MKEKLDSVIDETRTPYNQDEPAYRTDDDDRRWEWLLLLLALLMSFGCVFCSTRLAFGVWPDRLAPASLLAQSRADYGGGPGDAQFAVVDPLIGAQAATDAARLQMTPAGVGTGDPGARISLLPATPTPTTVSKPIPTLPSPTVPPTSTSAPPPTDTAVPTPTVAAPTATSIPSPTLAPPTPVPSPTSPPATATSPPPSPVPPTSAPAPTTAPPPSNNNDDDNGEGENNYDPPVLLAIQPILETVQDNGNCTSTAVWGYQNDNAVPVTRPIGAANMFNPPPPNRGQPVTFNPGRASNVFSTIFTTASLIWQLDGSSVTANSASACQITGRVFEDTNYSGGPGTAFENGIDVGLPNVQVELYDSGGVFLSAVVTDASGNYTLTVAGNGSYIVRVISASIGDSDTPPAAGFNGGFSGAVAEQTYEHNGVSGNGGAGALGGNAPLIADTNTLPGAGVGDTHVPVTVSGTNLTGVAFGFAYTLVTNPNDSGQGSLRQALANANAQAGTDTIWFNLAGAGPYTIRPGSALPPITDPVIVDGSSQPGFAGGPLIELDGTNAGGAAAGLVITAGSSTVQGLVINRFADGIEINGGNGNTIQGNYIGTDVAGTTLVGNGQHGVFVVDSSNNLIGGTTPGAENLIAGNGANGVTITGASQRDTVLGNRIYGNGSLGIDLDNDGVTPNDIGGADSGANGLLNFPDIYSWTIITPSVIITGETRSGTTVEFFIADGDPSGHGEGPTLLARAVEGSAADSNGAVGAIDPSSNQFTFTLPVGSLTSGDQLTATATTSSGDSSEFSDNVP